MSRACSFCVPPWFVACLCDRQAGRWSGLSWNHTRRMPCGPEWQLGNRTTRITRTFFSSSIWLIPVFECWTWNDNGRSRAGSVSFFLYKIHLNNSHGKVTLTGLKGGFQFGIERGTDLTHSLLSFVLIICPRTRWTLDRQHILFASYFRLYSSSPTFWHCRDWSVLRVDLPVSQLSHNCHTPDTNCF